MPFLIPLIALQEIVKKDGKKFGIPGKTLWKS